MKKAIFIGHDPREQDAFDICVRSIMAHASEEIPIVAVSAPMLESAGLYQRPTERRDNVLWDVISDAPMATQFSIARFGAFIIAREMGAEAAMFCDCDFMFRDDITRLFDEFDSRYAVQVVKHEQKVDNTVKMDGQVQTAYARKNWSSCFLFAPQNPANAQMNVAKLNAWSGRALHQFKWLEDSEIGDISPDWNHLVGVDQPDDGARGVHFTLGIPSMAGYENQEHADEWRAYGAQ